MLVVHDTPFRALDLAPVGLGVLWIVQRVPFQRSASVTRTPALLWYCPVAVQAVLVVHDTPFEALAFALAGLGVLLVPQLVRFQAAATVSSTPSRLPQNAALAMSVLVVHDTPFRALDLAPVGLGVLWIVQLLPFQTSASVTTVPALLV